MPPVKKSPAVGIDLGTTFSVIAQVDAYGLPRTILNSEGDATLPSAVMFDRDSMVTGKEALRAAAQDPDLVVRFAKREMGNRHYSRKIAGGEWAPEMIQSFILKRLKDDAEKVIGPFREAVITVPAYFNDPRRHATVEAGRLAELDVLDIINEPTAAAVAYAAARPTPESGRELVMVYDLGGGTFDVTLVEVAGDHFQTLATDGDVKLGGCDWDMAIVDYICDEFGREHRGLSPKDDPGTFQKLMLQAEDVKRALSQKTEAKIFLDPPYQFRCALTRDKFEELTRSLVNRTQWTLEKVRKAARKEWSDINTVLLVGGSGKMPMISKMLREVTGKTPNESVSKDEAIAHGAALYAKALLDRRAGASGGVTIGNVNAHPLGVKIKDPDYPPGANRYIPSIILPANQRLPASSKPRRYRLSGQGRTLRIEVFESPNADCTQGCIGQFHFHLNSAVNAGEPVEISFTYDPDGRLKIVARLPRTGDEFDGELVRSIA